MRVAFTGKGGSGKTTLSALFAEISASDKVRTLAIDADINQHLAGALGAVKQARYMGHELDVIKQHLIGDNNRLSVETMHKTSPPGHGSRLVTLSESDWLIKNFALETSSGVLLLQVGDIPEENVGVKCYHGMNGSVELVLGHMVDDLNDLVVVDMTAGADAFSSSLFTKVDALVIVVEPTLKSISVYEQFVPHCKEYNVPILLIANKITDSEDLEFIKRSAKQPDFVMGDLKFVRQRERGQFVSPDDSSKEVMRQLRKAVFSLERDWTVLQHQAYKLHEKNAKSWMGEAVLDQIDESFSLEKVAKQILQSA